MSSVLDFVVSAPETERGYGASLVPLRRYKPVQLLFGADAQLASFGSAVAAVGERVWFAPFPQLFSPSAPVESLDPARTVHIRFGPPAYARVLKGLGNVAFVAESPEFAPLNIGRHPLGDGSTLPNSFARACGLGHRRTPLKLVAGGEPNWVALPDGFAVHDLQRAAEPASAEEDEDDALEQIGANGLQLISAADFDPKAWALASPTAGTVSPRFAALTYSGRSPAVLIPWNIAHPGSSVPGILKTLSEAAGVEGAPVPVLFPFNETTTSAERLSADLKALEAESKRGNVLRHVFLARLKRVEASFDLRRIFQAAWLDSSDPEHAWSVLRLRRAGLACVAFGSDGLRPESKRLEVHDDELGPRLVSRPQFSLRACAFALRRASGTAGSVCATVSLEEIRAALADLVGAES